MNSIALNILEVMTNRKIFWCYQHDSVIRTERVMKDLNISHSSFGATYSLAHCSTIRQIKWQFVAERTAGREKKYKNKIERHQTSGRRLNETIYTKYFVKFIVQFFFFFIRICSYMLRHTLMQASEYVDYYLGIKMRQMFCTLDGEQQSNQF